MEADGSEHALASISFGPIPFDDHLNLRNITEGTVVKLQDANGRLLGSYENTEALLIPPSLFTLGVYLLHSEQIGFSTTNKLVK
ncbi:MAG: hypothetical protein ACI8ZN_002338 [Bacteroidia bacterium]|jgi:hypothetical protein